MVSGPDENISEEKNSDWFRLIYILSFGLLFFGGIFLVWRKNDK